MAGSLKMQGPLKADEFAGEAAPAQATSTVLGFDKNGLTRKAAEETWRALVRSWRRESTPSFNEAGGPRK